MDTSFLKLTLALILFHAVAAQRAVQLSTIATNGNKMHSLFNGSTYNAAGGKYLVVQDASEGEPAGRLMVFIRDDSQTYNTYVQMEWPRWSAQITTNGNWIGTLDESGFVDTCQLDSTNSFVNITSFSSSARFIQFLSDDTLVLINQSSIDTYEYVDGSWTKILHQEVSFSVSPYLQLGGSNKNDSMPHLTDTTLAAFNPVTTTVELYTRNANKSWTLVDEIPIDVAQYGASRIVWNGVDTVVLADHTYVQNTSNYGSIAIMEKKGGLWIASTRTFLGYSMLLLDRNLIAISAPSENAGSVLYLQRKDGTAWEYSIRFTGTQDQFYFGFSLMQNDYEIFIQTATTDVLTYAYQAIIPQCYLPLKYECLDIVVDTCPTSGTSNYKLYKVTVGEYCTTVNVVNTQVNGNIRTYTFSFSRLPQFEARYCNATITCLNPPTTTPTSPPVHSDPPIGSPLSQPGVSPTSPGIPNAAPISAPVMGQPLAVPISAPLSVPSNVPISITPVASPSAPSSSPTSMIPTASPSVPTTSPISNVPVGSPKAPVASPSEAGRSTTSDSPLPWLDIAAIVCAAIVSLL